MESSKGIAAAVSIALVLAASLGVVAIYAFPGAASTTSSASTTTIISNTTTIWSRTLPCGSPGVTCGGVNLTSASLTVNGSYSVLQVTVAETGNACIGSATVYVNGTVIGVPPPSGYEPPGNIPLDIQGGQQAVLVLTIPNSTMPIHAGMTYSVVVYAWEGPPGQRASSGGPYTISVKAA